MYEIQKRFGIKLALPEDTVLVSGIVKLQERLSHDEIIIVVTKPDGSTENIMPDPKDRFSVQILGSSGAYTIRAEHSSFLPVEFQGELEQGDSLDLDEAILLGGDLNGDMVIDELDVVQIAGVYLETAAHSDINGDGIVDLIDLNLLAGNFRMQGAQEWNRIMLAEEIEVTPTVTPIAEEPQDAP